MRGLQELYAGVGMKWLLKNIRGRTAYAPRNPGYALSTLYRELTFSDERFLARICGVSPLTIRHFLDEPGDTPEFAQHISNAVERFRALSFQSADLYAKKILNQYAAIRALKPSCILETGIANGVSSSYLLLALQKNGKGQLHSIGLADPAFLPAGKTPGWLVPKWLRSRWSVHIGDSKEVLPTLLAGIDQPSVFIHDSLHTYEHMIWEFRVAYPHLPLGGLLFADDAVWNDSFADFAREVRASHARILHGVGFLRKDEV
jgi:hypothetical protein